MVLGTCLSIEGNIWVKELNVLITENCREKNIQRAEDEIPGPATDTDDKGTDDT